MSQHPSSDLVPPSGTMIIPITDVMNSHVRKGLNYWRSLRGERKFPARKDLHLRDMTAFLPYIVIVTVVDDGADYEYRHVGAAQREAFRVHFNGMRLSQIEAAVPHLGLLLRSAYEQVRSSGLPFAVCGRVGDAPNDSMLLYHETIFLPLGASDTRVDNLLIVGVFAPTPFGEIPTDELALLAGHVRKPPYVS